jgi:hypothetical protein
MLIDQRSGLPPDLSGLVEAQPGENRQGDDDQRKTGRQNPE